MSKFEWIDAYLLEGISRMAAWIMIKFATNIKLFLQEQMG